jgi:hypothetical protein
MSFKSWSAAQKPIASKIDTATGKPEANPAVADAATQAPKPFVGPVAPAGKTGAKP